MNNRRNAFVSKSGATTEAPVMEAADEAVGMTSRSSGLALTEEQIAGMNIYSVFFAFERVDTAR